MALEILSLLVALGAVAIVVPREGVLSPAAILGWLNVVYIALPPVLLGINGFAIVQHLVIPTGGTTIVSTYYALVLSVGTVLMRGQPSALARREVRDADPWLRLLLLACCAWLLVLVFRLYLALGFTGFADRDVAFGIYESMVGAVDVLVVYTTCAAVALRLGSKADWSVAWPLALPVSIDLLIAGRTFTTAAVIAIGFGFWLGGKRVRMRIALLALMAILSIQLLRTRDWMVLFDPARGHFDLIGEPLNVFAAAVIVANNGLSGGWSDIAAKFLRHLMPPGTGFVQGTVLGTSSSSEAFGITLNIALEQHESIMGLAGSSVAEGLYFPLAWIFIPWVIILVMWAGKRLAQSYSAAFVLLFAITTVRCLGFFRWGAFDTAFVAMQYGLYVALPLHLFLGIRSRTQRITA